MKTLMLFKTVHKNDTVTMQSIKNKNNRYYDGQINSGMVGNCSIAHFFRRKICQKLFRKEGG